MAFIKTTDMRNGITRHISAEHILEVRKEGEGSCIAMAVANQTGSYSFYVKETVEDVLSQVAVALAYRRGS